MNLFFSHSKFHFFLNLKEYKLAQFHCYGRYLTKHVQRSLTLGEAAELDADAFCKIHLPNGFDDMASATMVVGVQSNVQMGTGKFNVGG